MNMEICSIHDTAAQAYMTPMFFQSRGQAIRSFSDAVNDGKSDFYKHPEDYTLFHLGSFNERTGSIDIAPAPAVLTTGINIKQDITQ